MYLTLTKPQQFSFQILLTSSPIFCFTLNSKFYYFCSALFISQVDAVFEFNIDIDDVWPCVMYVAYFNLIFKKNMCIYICLSLSVADNITCTLLVVVVV